MKNYFHGCQRQLGQIIVPLEYQGKLIQEHTIYIVPDPLTAVIGHPALRALGIIQGNSIHVNLNEIEMIKNTEKLILKRYSPNIQHYSTGRLAKQLNL